MLPLCGRHGNADNPPLLGEEEEEEAEDEQRRQGGGWVRRAEDERSFREEEEEEQSRGRRKERLAVVEESWDKLMWCEDRELRRKRSSVRREWECAEKEADRFKLWERGVDGGLRAPASSLYLPSCLNSSYYDLWQLLNFTLGSNNIILHFLKFKTI